MDIAEALKITKALADGINPYTGEVLEDSNLYQHPQTVRALYTLLQSLEKAPAKKLKPAALPERQGQAWESEEDQQLTDLFNQGAQFKDLVRQHKRTHGAIKARLVRLGLLEREAVND